MEQIHIGKILVSRQHLTQAITRHIRVFLLVRSNTVSVQAHLSGSIDSAHQMILLSNDQHLVCLENITRTIHTLISAEAGMVHKNILRLHIPFLQKLRMALTSS